MNDFFLNKVLSNPINILAMIVLFTAVCHAVILPLKLSKQHLKTIDYIWLFFAVLGLLTLASDVRIFVAAQWLEQDRLDVINQLTRAQEFYVTTDDSHHCVKFILTENSPSDLEERQRQQDLVCHWRKSVSTLLSALNPKELPEIQYSNFPKPAFDSSYESDVVNGLKDRITWYNESRSVYVETKSLSERGNAEELLFYFSPFFLAFALGLRLAKTTAELRQEGV